MSQLSLVQPALLSKMNERQVLRTLQTYGPLSRAEVARHSGISAPTASRAVEALLRAGLLEEGEAPELSRGRPGKKLRLATATAQVLALVIDAEQCRLVSAGLDGKLHDAPTDIFPTPDTYDGLIDVAAHHALQHIQSRTLTTLGMAISIPGLLDSRDQRSLLSPNVPITNAHSPSEDLAQRLGIPCVLVQESHALCLAEHHFGLAQNLDNFAVMDVSIGIGLSVMVNGRLLTGHSGLAGEIGHITVQIDGRPCGCGNRGCLETVASDSALAWRISQRLGRRLSVSDVLQLARKLRETGSDSAYTLAPDIESVYNDSAHPTVHDVENVYQEFISPLAPIVPTHPCNSPCPTVTSAELATILAETVEENIRYLSIGVAAAINLFNPSTLFVHGKLFEIDPTLFGRLVSYTHQRTLAPAFDACHLRLACGSKRQGAIAAIIDHLTNSVVPSGLGVRS